LEVSILEAVDILSQKFLMQDGVCGVSYVSGSHQRLRVYVESEYVAWRVPDVILGYPVEVKVVGRIYALGVRGVSVLTGVSGDKRWRWRPICGGISVGVAGGATGTIACRVYDRSTGEVLILSNRHVFSGNVNTPVIQPGPADGGLYPDDVVGYVYRFIDVKPPPLDNRVDAALAKPTVDVSDEVLDVGVVFDTAVPVEGVSVCKSGRSTCYTCGKIIDTHASVKVYGYPFGYAIFTDQVIVEPAIGAPGDSGSLVVEEGSKRAVGLLFAGSDVVAVFNKIGYVLGYLNVSLKPAAPAAYPIVSPMYIVAASAPLLFTMAVLGFSEVSKYAVV
jgi:hypothetical protein